MSKPLPRAIQRDLDAANAYQEAIKAQQQVVRLEPGIEAEPLLPAEPPIVIADVAPKVDETELWKQRYLSFKGDADAKLQRSQQEMRDLTAQVQHLQARVNEPPKAPKQKLVTEKDATDFGEDMLDLIDRKVREALQDSDEKWQGHVNALEAQLHNAQQVLGSVSQNQVDTAQERFYTTLGSLVPTFRDVNVDPAFLAWLDGTDELSGMRRDDLLQKAATDLNPQRTATIFNAFIRLQPAAPAAANPADAIQNQITPSTRAVQAAPIATQGNQGRIFTSEQVSWFYKHQTKAKYSPEEYARLETEINKAISEGRVSP